MRERRGRAMTAVFVAAIAAALCACPLATAAGPRQSGTLAFTTAKPATSTGSDLDFAFVNPDDPSQKPYAAARMVIHMPPGTLMDTTVPPQCHATDAEIYLLGPAACPPESKVGSGLAVADTGGGTTSETKLTHFNNQDEVVGIGVNEVEAIKTIDRTRIEGETTTSNFPLFPGVPPPEPYTPVKSVEIHFPPYSRDGRPYMRTPPTCPSAGYWTFVVEFTYRDGVTESTESRSPCAGRKR